VVGRDLVDGGAGTAARPPCPLRDRDARESRAAPHAVTSDPFQLQRFVEAQQRVYELVLSELRAGAKRSQLDVVRLSADRGARR